MLSVIDLLEGELDIFAFIESRQDEYVICFFGGAFTEEGVQYNRPGYYSGVMYYNGYKKILDENCKGVKSANHAILLGISKMIDFVNLNDRPINILVTLPLGFSSAQRGCGANVGVVLEIIKKCKSNNSKLTVYQWKNGGEKLKQYINNEILNVF